MPSSQRDPLFRITKPRRHNPPLRRPSAKARGDKGPRIACKHLYMARVSARYNQFRCISVNEY